MIPLLLVGFQFLAGAACFARLGRRLPSAGACLAVGLALTVLLELANRWLGLVAFFPLFVQLTLVALIGGGKGLRFLRLPCGPTLPSRRPLRTYLLLLGCMLLLAGYLYIWCAGVPVANYDVLSYHIPLAWGLAQPDKALSPLFHPTTFYARMPLAGSLLESRFVGAGADASGVGLHLFLIATTFAGASAAARCAAWLGARTAGRLLAAILYLYHPLLTGAVINAVMEPMVGLMAIAGAELLLVGASRRGRLLHFLLAGLLAGTAMAIKFSAAGTAVIPLGIIAGCYALRHLRARQFGRFLREPLLFGVGVLVAMAPWFARGVALGGHPMFPFQGEDANWRHEQAQFVVDQHHPQSPLSAGYWADFARKNGSLGYPAGAVLQSLRLVQSAGAVPLSLALLLAIWAAVRRPKLCLPWLIAAGVGYAAWLTVRLNPDRFLVGSAVLLVPLGACAAAANLMRSPARLIGLLASIAAVGGVQLPLLRDAFTTPAIYRAESRRALVESEKVMRIIDIATDEAQRGKLLLLFEARAGLFPGNTEYTTVWDQPSWAPLLRGAANDAEFARRLRDAGYTGILVNDAEWGRLLDFYASQWTGARQKLYGHFGILANLPPDQLLTLLRSFPPYHFARFTDAELQVLADFLLSQRLQSVIAAPVPGGYNCEVWFATIKVTGGTGAGDSLLRERQNGT